MWRACCVVASAWLLSLLTVTGAGAVSLAPVGEEFDQPIYVTSAPDDPDRLFVVEQGGVIKQVAGGSESSFADLSTLVSSGGERGLLSIALAPDFGDTGRLYVDYTGNEEPGEIHVAELQEDEEGEARP